MRQRPAKALAKPGTLKEALDRIERGVAEVGRIVWSTSRFKPDPEMNDGYLKNKRDGGR